MSWLGFILSLRWWQENVSPASNMASSWVSMWNIGVRGYMVKKVSIGTTRTPSQCPVIFSELLRFKRIAPQSNGHFFHQRAVHHISRFYPIISIAAVLCTKVSTIDVHLVEIHHVYPPTFRSYLLDDLLLACPPVDSTRFNSIGCAKKFDSNCYGDRPLHWFIGVAATPKSPPKKVPLKKGV